MYAASPGPLGLEALLSGVSRAARLSSARGSEHDQVIWDTGADIIGPMVFLFMWWVLEEAEKRGIGRLFLYARDGDIMIKVGNIIKEAWGYGTELSYLYGSRGIWFPLALGGIGDFEWSWLTSGFTENVSLDEVCRRLMMDRGRFGSYLEKKGFNGPSWTENLNGKELKSLRACLTVPSFREELAPVLKNEFDKAVDYLEQEKLFDGRPFAIVDTGWAGRCQYAMSSMMAKAGKYPAGGIDGFYIGISDSAITYGNDRLHHFLFDWSKERTDARLSNFLFFELMMSTDHGRTTGYKRAGGRVEPLLSDTGVAEAIRWGIRTQHESASRFAGLAVKYIDKKLFNRKKAAGLLKKILVAFMHSPSRREADAYGDFLIAAEILERDFQKFAPRLGYGDVWRVITGREKFKGFWVEGVLARSEMNFLSCVWAIAIRLGLFSVIKKFILKCS